MAKEKIKFWNIAPILSKGALYNLIIGERSNGKTYGVLQYGLEEYFSKGSEIAIIRRMEEDFRGGNGQQMFANLVENGVISKLSKGKWNGVKYYASRWYLTLTKISDDGKQETIVDENPFAYAFALSKEQHYKSTAFPRVRTILFDEFLTRGYYLPDEFISFQNVLSTIIRLRDDVIIFMTGNTVNKYSPYFSEMGLTNIQKMKRGNIDLYSYGETGLTVAVEYSDFPSKKKASDKYFAFNNPRLKMITNGTWEIDIYPHLPVKYVPKNILYMYFINFNRELLQCEIIRVDNLYFTYIHRKTTPIKDDNKYLVYQEETDARPNYRKNIRRPITNLEKRIVEFYRKDKVFYQDNEVGEIVRNYLMNCSQL